MSLTLLDLSDGILEQVFGSYSVKDKAQVRSVGDC